MPRLPHFGDPFGGIFSVLRMMTPRFLKMTPGFLNTKRWLVDNDVNSLGITPNSNYCLQSESCTNAPTWGLRSLLKTETEYALQFEKI